MQRKALLLLRPGTPSRHTYPGQDVQAARLALPAERWATRFIRGAPVAARAGPRAARKSSREEAWKGSFLIARIAMLSGLRSNKISNFLRLTARRQHSCRRHQGRGNADAGSWSSPPRHSLPPYLPWTGCPGREAGFASRALGDAIHSRRPGGCAGRTPEQPGNRQPEQPGNRQPEQPGNNQRPRGPKMAVPTRTRVAPSAMAASKSPLMPMESSARQPGGRPGARRVASSRRRAK